jgi:hypothetical protein
MLSVPPEIENATYEAANIHLTTPNALSVDFVPAKYRKVSVDGAISLEYADFSSSNEVQSTFKRVEEALSMIISGRNLRPVNRLSGEVFR